VLSQRERAVTNVAPAPAAAPEQPAAPAAAARALTDDSLPSFVADLPDGALLNFHSTTCSHCRALAPEFEAAAQELEEKGGAPLAFVDVAAAPKAAERYGVVRYPTMLWFRGGEPVLELPPTVRKAEKIAEYVEWASQPAVVYFESREEFEEALPQMRAVLGGSTPPLICGFGTRNGLHTALEAAAEKLRGKTLFVFTEEVREGDPALRAYYADEKLDQEFMGRMEQEAVFAWVKSLLKKSKAKRSS